MGMLDLDSQDSIEEFDVVIIGGGVVGLACAYSLTQSSTSLKRVLLIEKHERFGTECTSRNSEVIHAGIYYSPGSLKESLCLEGKERLYRFCVEQDVPFKKCGKWIVGNVGDELALEKIHSNAIRNHVPLEILTRTQIEKGEPNLCAEFGLNSPTTGVIDSEAFVQKLAHLCEKLGVILINRTQLIEIHKEKNSTQYILQMIQGDEKFQVKTQIVVNAAGWSAAKIAADVLGAKKNSSKVKYVRGHYFSLKNVERLFVSRLIYPVPDVKAGGLGIHLTLDMGGGIKLGPDTDWRYESQPDFKFYEDDISVLQEKFFLASKRYLKSIEITDLSPAYVGVRPKWVSHTGEMLDFYIEEEGAAGFPGWINLIGIESPGLTSALAIGEKVSHLIKGGG